MREERVRATVSRHGEELPSFVVKLVLGAYEACLRAGSREPCSSSSPSSPEEPVRWFGGDDCDRCGCSLSGSEAGSPGRSRESWRRDPGLAAGEGMGRALTELRALWVTLVVAVTAHSDCWPLL